MRCLPVLVLIGLVVAAVAVAFMLGRGSFGGDGIGQLLAPILGEAPKEVVVERVKEVLVEVTREVPKEVKAEKEVIKEEVVKPKPPTPIRTLVWPSIHTVDPESGMAETVSR